MKLIIIDNYDSFIYNLVQLVEQAGVSDYLILKNDELDKLGAKDFDRVLISPGPGIAKEAGQLMWFLKKFHSSVPMLGICLGHEAIAELFGAKLVQMKEPMHGIKNKASIVVADRIFNGLPSNFFIGHYHSWNIDEQSIPHELEIILRDENNLNMAIRHKKLDLTGLQFHPESIMTDYGLEMIKNWLAQ
ncbi:MAG: aminodeoxychorismate/anthranilate synthase component II [Bacteroidetes bacterium]|nr:aminodeoxychorismate/anthranilate synthase component II [Bacteroidota bacterium]MBL6943922.1 aminodeoxychorismate/anthranilate synthase component II [Bacteroidales bacterium]